MASKTLKPFTMSAVERVAPAEPGKRDTYPHPRIQGLHLRVTDTGAKSFFFEARVKGGAKINQTIGKFPACTIDDAEREAKKLSSQMVEGVDPREIKAKAKKEPTFGELFAWYVEGTGKKKQTTLTSYRQTYDTHLKALTNKKATELTKAEIRALHEQITKSGATYAANRTLALIRAIYNKAAKEDRIVGVNPAIGIQLNEEKSREVRLLPSQLGAFIGAIDAYPDPAFRDFFTLCLLTGQRKNNILAMQWADVHLADRLWIIPDTKNGRPLNVPLMDDEVAILERRKVAAKGSWVFPSHGVTGHLVEPKAAWRTILEKAGIAHGALRIHDLRRTLGSLMGDAGVSLPTIGKTLGHMSQLTTAIYARLSLDPVREAKLQAHAVYAAARLVQGDKVVEMAQRRAIQ